MIKIEDKEIGENRPCFIIAEAGINHNGKLSIAKQLVKAAKDVGADAVKFQTFKTEELVTKDSIKPKHFGKKNEEQSVFDLLKGVELKKDDYVELARYAKEVGIIFMSSAIDMPSADLLAEIGVKVIKVASCDLTNLPLLEHIAKKKLPMIIATGLSNMAEVKTALKIVYSAGNKDVVLLHCASLYPPRLEDHNLRSILTMQKELKVPIGYSDHSMTTIIPAAAVALGACVIEKHFTLDKNMPGPDQKASIGLAEFKQMVDDIRTVEKALGSYEKAPSGAEVQMRDAFRRSLVARSNVKQGQTITKELIAIKRPGTGLAPDKIGLFIGKKAKVNIKEDDFFRLSDIEG